MEAVAEAISVDYLVVGAGAMGMAFADVLLTETDATVAIVDKRSRPGGHWNTAYPHVRLHQPSAFYGVNSRPLGSGIKDAVGFNAGLYELASGAEVVAYFDQVMNQRFVPSGRVTYLPMSVYHGDGHVSCIPSGVGTAVSAGITVDASYMNVTVPSMRPPDFEIADGVRCIPPNDLTQPGVLPASQIVVIGAGKTAMDACLWSLQCGVDANSITWVRPRDSWCLNRRNIQPGPEFVESSLDSFTRQIELCAEAESVEALFDGLEIEGLLLRLDRDVTPTMYRCATVTESEVDALRQIATVVRKGRVQRLDRGEMTLEQGVVATAPDTVFVDCTADGLERRPAVPVFAGDTITLQAVRTCQQVFSAAFVAHVECAYGDEDVKNDLAGVIPHPKTDIDWLRTTLANMVNSARWRQDEQLSRWLVEARLDAFSELRRDAGAGSFEGDYRRRLDEAGLAAVENLQRMIAACETGDGLP